MIKGRLVGICCEVHCLLKTIYYKSPGFHLLCQNVWRNLPCHESPHKNIWQCLFAEVRCVSMAGDMQTEDITDTSKIYLVSVITCLHIPCHIRPKGLDSLLFKNKFTRFTFLIISLSYFVKFSICDFHVSNDHLNVIYSHNVIKCERLCRRETTFSYVWCVHLDTLKISHVCKVWCRPMMHCGTITWLTKESFSGTMIFP